MGLSISSAILDELQRQARAGVPLEICGLLFGGGGNVSHSQQAGNIAENPEYHFEIDPAQLIASERAARNGGSSIIGYYHSHPTGDVRPSQTDADNAAPDDRIWLILNGKEVAAWRAVKNGEIFDRFNSIALDC